MSVNESLQVPGNEAELKALDKSSERYLDEVIHFGRLYVVIILKIFLFSCISLADIVVITYFYHIALDNIYDMETIVVRSKI